jgi:hypothetical protein
MMQNWHEYLRLKSEGYSAERIYAQAKSDGMTDMYCIKLVMYVFELDVPKAKDVMVRANGLAESLNSYQQKLFDSITEDERRELLD